MVVILSSRLLLGFSTPILRGGRWSARIWEILAINRTDLSNELPPWTSKAPRDHLHCWDVPRSVIWFCSDAVFVVPRRSGVKMVIWARALNNPASCPTQIQQRPLVPKGAILLQLLPIKHHSTNMIMRRCATDVELVPCCCAGKPQPSRRSTTTDFSI